MRFKKKYLFYIYCYFKCTFLSLEPVCLRIFIIFMLCILMNNKDLFDSIDGILLN